MCLALTTCAHCPESGQSNQITEEPIITFHAYMMSRRRGMGMAEPGYGTVLSGCITSCSTLITVFVRTRKNSNFELYQANRINAISANHIQLVSGHSSLRRSQLQATTCSVIVLTLMIFIIARFSMQ